RARSPLGPQRARARGSARGRRRYGGRHAAGRDRQARSRGGLVPRQRTDRPRGRRERAVLRAGRSAAKERPSDRARAERAGRLMNPVLLFVGLLVLAYLGSILVGGRAIRGYGLPSGAEYVLLGLLLGPHVLGVLTRDTLTAFQPLS